jgi:regulator of sigma E protease
MSIIIFIVVLGALIFVHELGHFLVAKKSGIRVDEFAIGFPPRIFSWVRNGTRYALNLIPFGGYVKIFGENPDEDSLAKDAKDSFVNKSKSTQASVLIAGVLFNVLFAWILFSWAFMIGFDVQKDTFNFVDNESAKTQVVVVEENTPAERAGLLEGDEVFSLRKGDEEVALGNSTNAIGVIRSTETPFVLNTNRGEISIESKMEIDGEEVVGFYLGDTINTKTGFFESIWHGFLLTGFSVKEISVALYDLIFDSVQGQADLENIAGPVGIVGLVGEAAAAGLISLILFTAFISINLALLNLLPFPALDGGRLLFILIEVITRKDINHKVANALNLIGFAILIIFMIVITVSDIGKLF